MTHLEQLFAPRSPSGWRVAKIGIVSLLVKADGSWLVRIGGAQWEGLAADEPQAMQRAAQMVAEQLRDITIQLIKLKKLGEI